MTSLLSFPFGISLNVSLTPVYNPSIEEETTPPQGNRKKPLPLHCTISEYGISYQAIEAPEVLFYEIYDLNGDCVAFFGDEISFVEYLFTLSGEYQLRFTTPNYEFVGYVLIN